ncbi:MAG TPA: carbohydrate-binding protein [Blastocatellia bacterium]|nr:carbohydrate-binding protein [Blastocatellia bacterium]
MAPFKWQITFATVIGLVILSLTTTYSFVLQPQSPEPAAERYLFRPAKIVAGGYIPGLIAHPTEPGLIYARTDIGSVYQWDRYSDRWVPLTDFNAPDNYNLNGPESIALDPNDPDRLYIAAGMYTSGPFAFLVSTDRGATFSVYPAPFAMAANNDGRAAGERLAVNPFRPNQLLMGTRSSGLWVSEDHAQTWNRVATFPVQSSTDGFGVQWVVFDPKKAGTVYAGSYTNAMVYASADHGATWAPLPGQPIAWPFNVASGTRPPAPGRAVVNPDGALYVTFSDLPGPNNMNYGLVEKYDPNTGTWTNITPPFDGIFQTGPRGGFCGITQDPARPGTVAVSTFARWYPVDTIYLTRDGGRTWTDLGSISSSVGLNGPPYGNYYFNFEVVSSIAPWLTFGNSNYPNSPNPSAKFGWWMSAILIDPTAPDHVMFATGATIYATDHVSAADAGMAPGWYVQAEGIEETAVLDLISPTRGAHLLSGVGDIGGFRHDDFSVASQMYTNPTATTLRSLDWAGRNPDFIVRTQTPQTASTSPCHYGAYSTDGGANWAPFPACATGGTTGNVGTIAVDAGGGMLMWTPASGAANRPQFSTDNGATWTASTGLPARVNARADKVTPGLFYAFYSNSGPAGGFYRSSVDPVTGAVDFARVSTTTLPTTGGCNGSGCGVIAANWAKSGDLWLPLGSNGLYHSTDGGVTWSRLDNVSWANSVAVGATVPRTGTQSVFLYGTASPLGVKAIYRSDNNGASWIRVNDDQHQYAGPTLIQADPRVYGRVYLGMNGRGIIIGDPVAAVVR